MVWDEAVRVTLDMMDNVWKNKEVVPIDHAVDITLSVRHHILKRHSFFNIVYSLHSLSSDLLVRMEHEYAHVTHYDFM